MIKGGGGGGGLESELKIIWSCHSYWPVGWCAPFETISKSKFINMLFSKDFQI